MKQRTELLKKLDKSIAEHSWELCSELCFRVLFGLPAELQIELPRFMMRRYLPIFEIKWPDIKWPRQLLNDLEKWVKEFSRYVPEESDRFDPADAAFLFSFDALLLAYYYRMNQATLTSSCVCTIDSVINARETNVWIADDPEGVEMWKMQGYFPGRSVAENSAAIAIAEREWGEADKWLNNKAVWTYPDVIDLKEVEEALNRWKEHEMLLVVPEARENLRDFVVIKGSKQTQ